VGRRRTDELRRLLAAATPGPWNADGLTLRPGTVWNEHGNDLARAWLPSDAALIVAAVNALPILLGALEIIAAAPTDAPDAIGVTARNVARAALARLDASA
jgi:hypothetical protein